MYFSLFIVTFCHYSCLSVVIFNNYLKQCQSPLIHCLSILPPFFHIAHNIIPYLKYPMFIFHFIHLFIFFVRHLFVILHFYLFIWHFILCILTLILYLFFLTFPSVKMTNIYHHCIFFYQVPSAHEQRLYMKKVRLLRPANFFT